MIAGQAVEPAPGSDGTDGRWQITRKVAKDRVISFVDPEARRRHKTVSRKQDSFEAHLAIEPDTALVTGCELTKAAGPQAADGAVGTDLLNRDDSITEPVELLGDSAYGTGDALDKIEQTGDTPLVKPWPTRPAAPGAFDNDDITVDGNAATVTCPADLTRPISPKRKVTFGATCRGCPFAAQCTTARDGRTLHLHLHDRLQRQHRQREKDPKWQATYRQHRPIADGRTVDCLAGGRREPQSPLPRRHQEQRLAPQPRRRFELKTAGQPRPGPA